MNKSVRSVLLLGGMLAAAIMFMFLGNRQFHNQAFHGIVDSSYWGKGKDNHFYVVIDGNSHAVDVHPVSKTGPIEKIVTKGDSLFKKQNTDTVVLVHQKQVFKYTLNRGISLFAN